MLTSSSDTNYIRNKPEEFGQYHPYILHIFTSWHENASRTDEHFMKGIHLSPFTKGHPDSNVGWPNVCPTSVLSSRRWANVRPTFIAVWAVMWYFGVFYDVSPANQTV